MANYQTGQASWEDDDVVVQGGKFEKVKPMPLLRMEYNKSYRIRIISKPYRYYAKWVKTAKGKKIKLNSSLTPDCPLCLDGIQPKLGRYIRVLYRNPTGTTEFKILDCGTQVYTGIKKIQDNADYGKDVSKYDLTISKGAEGSQPLYSVIPSPPAPMSDNDIVVAKSAMEKLADGTLNPDYINLEERCKALPVDVLQKILGAGAKTEAVDAPAADPEQGLFAPKPGAEVVQPVVEAAKPVVAAAVVTPAAPAKEKKSTATATKAADPVAKTDGAFLDF